MKVHVERWLGFREWGRWAAIALLPQVGLGWGTTYDSMNRTGNRWACLRLGFLAFHVEVHIDGDDRADLWRDDL